MVRTRAQPRSVGSSAATNLDYIFGFSDLRHVSRTLSDYLDHDANATVPIEHLAHAYDILHAAPEYATLMNTAIARIETGSMDPRVMARLQNELVAKLLAL